MIQEHLSSPLFLSIVFIHVKLHVFTLLVPCYDVFYDFYLNTMFYLSLTPVCFVRGSCSIYVICISLHILVSNTISISDDIRVVNSNTTGFAFLDH